LKQLFVLIVFSITYISCEAPSSQELSSGYNTSAASDLPIKWRSRASFPLGLKLSSQFDANEQTAIEDSADIWTDETNANTNFFTTSVENISIKSNLNDYDDSTFGIYKIHDWPNSLPSTALAVTQIRGRQKSSYIQITHADILVNYDFFSFATDGSWGYDLQTVIVHEMGHFLGLFHDDSSINNSVMYPSIGRFTVNQTPYDRDINNLVSKYGLNRSASSSRELVSQENEEEGVPVVITFELHANNKEVIKINGVVYEDFKFNHTNGHGNHSH